MKILIVDDHPVFAGVLKQALEAEGYKDVATAVSSERALDLLRAQSFDVILTDLRLPKMNGLQLMAEAKRRAPGLVIILMTAYAEVATARLALKQGAMDYLVKPFDNEELFGLLERVEPRTDSSGGNLCNDDSQFQGMVGSSPGMLSLFKTIRKAAHSNESVLILGESGTGKELVARAIHRLSARNRTPFMVIHSAALPATLVESELFGHEKGSFTGATARKLGKLEAADGGTAFFDEIGELPLELQPKLLRFLQEHQFMPVGGTETITVNVRTIAATNRDIDEEVKNGSFREDLFYRLDVIRIVLPPLKERIEDIPLLASHFLKTNGMANTVIEPDAMEALKNYSWPGNVRELENVLKRAILESESGPLTAASLPEKIFNSEQHEQSGDAQDCDSFDLTTNERQLIREAIRKAHGNKTEAAKLLGISRRKLYSRLERLQEPPDR